jgi:hypothetical protein
MVKGISRRVIVVDSPDSQLFEQAIFIVKNDALPGVTDQQVLGEACRIAQGCGQATAPPRLWKRLGRRGWLALAALAAVAVWVIYLLLL